MNLDFQPSLRPVLKKKENSSSAFVSTDSQRNSRVNVSCKRWKAGLKTVTVMELALLPVSRDFMPDFRIAS